MDDVYCAVCGVVFDVCAHVYRIRDEITPEVVAWTEQCISGKAAEQFISLQSLPVLQSTPTKPPRRHFIYQV